MKLAIVTDSTSDLRQAELDTLNVRRVPLYVSFQGNTYRDWLELDPARIVEGVAAGADLPTTSQPNPQDFESAFREAIEEGADQILCITISANLSGTFQSANIAAETVDVPVTLFDSHAASAGLGDMVTKAAELRDSGASLDEIVRALEHIRATNFLLFTVGNLDYLQKGGRIGRAGALLGSLLNIKPLLTLEEGVIAPVGRARGNKRALKEIVTRIEAYRADHPGDLVMSFLHIQDPAAAEALKAEIDKAGVTYRGGHVYEIGAVIASHVGPGTYGVYLHTDPA